ncbi:bifunctional phosphopantothenoylcysteine decarboxylase/phosphopantothenate--cysteine ligase CoaBC [Carboxylicivirga sp. A043]|uniref:bifunctional phosphopantothenoylcysteine decarboxylase/phosphopantothenate--cysteine ligase CoaBC n=1 Tax=Carboxylicivirga litoralis TaxID=2816963 RepID=UPI0021CB1865|nr:bifunctional phosphopantothenoylcysteine decarboxylase/phosphopantothenate--cysteine ligase CoaBC [Carboxylicivirga sp. A043]MCU4155415.1 bifunctional phosphopantothenoylcysteine decarboxylase/phosphopantothenate--cysteine ligase CoaBC [Carboxylicivirga sp. A043]
MLQGKKFILGISGGIAAYKCAQLTRLLVKEGAEVQVIMTKLAKQFITPLTMATLSKRPILVEFFDPENGAWNSHVDSGLWADAMIVAPATANTMGKMANGVADNLLITTYLSARCPVFVAPTMDLDMYQHPSTQRNMSTLRSYGNHLIEPNAGELASGLVGKGRMAEPEEIVAELKDFFAKKEKQDLSGKKVLVTAGPTHEKIDPVRFIGNYSSGKMGYALAEELADRGAKVTLVSGPTQISTLNPNIERINVVSAEEMYEASSSRFEQMDAAIMCAAVADYTPVHKADEKMKRNDNELSVELKATTDIAAALGEKKSDKQVLVGFALETQDAMSNAQKKLIKKNLDFIVLNSLKDKGAGFNSYTNKITIIDKHNKIKEFSLKSKADVASDIVDELVGCL